MKPHPTASIIKHFSSIPDPRINRKKLHKLDDIFFITLCAVVKSNEITAIPKLLMHLNITGAVVTMDAMGCQTNVAQQHSRKARTICSV